MILKKHSQPSLYGAVAKLKLGCRVLIEMKFEPVEKLRNKIKLVSSAKTGHFYTTTKNKRTMPEKLEMKKFDPTIRKYVMYKEAKIK